MRTTTISRRPRGLRIIVLGYLVRGPLGGLAWHPMQYVLGLARMGHEVYFVEDSEDYPCCYDPSRHVVDTDPSYGLKFTAHAFERFGLPDRWAYYDSFTTRWLGPAGGKIHSVLKSADVLINVSGVNPIRPWLEQIPRRALIDTDPTFLQIRHLNDPSARARAEQHTHFFSFAGNFGQPGCSVPADGFPWQPTRQPIALDAWTVTPGPQDGLFTTVMLWDGNITTEYQGRRYGVKADSFGPYMDLPKKTDTQLELALGNASAPRNKLTHQGWRLRDPLEVTRDPWTYQDYISASKAEFSVAKHGYVITRSGWFSDRSAAYMASGRPVLIQEAGFSDWLPTGAGVLSFSNAEEALQGIEAINGDYRRHCKKARELAEEYFDARRVLTDLLDKLM